MITKEGTKAASPGQATQNISSTMCREEKSCIAKTIITGDDEDISLNDITNLLAVYDN